MKPLIPYRPSFERVEIRAQLSLCAQGANGNSAELRKRAVLVLKSYYSEEREAILAPFGPLGAGSPKRQEALMGLGTARALSRLTDEIITALWDFTLTHVYRARNPTSAERLSLLAVGGYGRGELAPYSDLDLLFLRAYKSSAHAESVIEFILYALWDMGFKVGHASRTVEECLKLARDDHTILTSLLEQRLIAGDRELEQDLNLVLGPENLRAHMKPFIAAKLAERDLRHQKAGASRYLVEPNIKDGRGGLRDLHGLFWIAKFMTQTRTPHELQNAFKSLLTEEDTKRFHAAFEFFWKIRICLHQIAGRAEERLSFDYQPEVAKRLGFFVTADNPLVERFMRRYFVTAREVGTLTRIFTSSLEDQHYKPVHGLSQWIKSHFDDIQKPDHLDIVMINGRLGFRSVEAIEKNPLLMARLFLNADRLERDIHPEGFRAIAKHVKLIGLGFRRDHEASRLFRQILGEGKNPYRTLSLMAESGYLGRYIPEFGAIIAQTQFNMYHAYTVDEHTLKAIDIIHKIDKGLLKDEHPLASNLIKQVQDKDGLYLAMLLHDTGKGDAQGQEIAGEAVALKVGKRLGLEPWQTEQVAWLVKNHLVLSNYAQKRDISDLETIKSFAEIVQTPERLRLLLILTVADIRAVGPGVWNEWKGQLMRELVAATEAYFRGQHPKFIDQKLDDKKTALKEAYQNAFFSHCAPAYLTTTPQHLLERHARMFEALGEKKALVDAFIDEARQATVISILTLDRHGLFADLAEAFAYNCANVVSATAHTLKGGFALDVFYLQDGRGSAYGRDDEVLLARLKQSVCDYALGQKPIKTAKSALKPSKSDVFSIAPTVMFEDLANSTILEVSGRDRVGLLADLTRALEAHKVSIHSAHIDSYGERAVDAFYVSGAKKSGPVSLLVSGPLSASSKEKLKSALLSVLDMDQNTTNRTRARASNKR